MRFCDRIRIRREELNISQEELAKRMGYKSRSTINKIELGINDVSQSKIIAFAKALDTTVGYLMGDTDVTNTEPNIDYDKYGLKPVEKKRFPMLGKIACGKPIYCNEEYESYVEASADINADFCLIARGDSMINARIFDGDVVFIREQPTVNNGESAAVVHDDEATLKRVYIQSDRIILRAENPLYTDIVFEREEMNYVRILGKAVAFMSCVR